ncbi:MAG: coniferyl aldehyde dehydrogenase [Burkholderiales bacterium]
MSDTNGLEIERAHRVFALQQRAATALPTPDLAWRRTRLRALIDALRTHQDAIVTAVSADFGGRAESETRFIELMGPILQARHAMTDLRHWMQPRRRRTELLFITNSAWVEYHPKGVVGVIGAWNYPLYLSLGPTIAALAAGNRVMVKMPELVPRTTELLKRVLAERFPEDEVAVFGGDLAMAEAFGAIPFNHLVFTGSPRVGRQVMRAASANLTPVTLELGGKSPALIGPKANLVDAAIRIAHGKTFNAGQTCVAPDYVMVPRGQGESFAMSVIAATQRLYPSGPADAGYTSIVSERHATRLQTLIDDAAAKGAKVMRDDPHRKRTERQMPLHVLVGASPDMRVMQEEIFGPILPVFEYDRLNDALDHVRKGERPLALYTFGLDQRDERLVLDSVQAGGVTIDDWGWHVMQHDLPFGGIGNSGMGTYHGEEGFRELSHARSVFKRNRWFPMGLFYPPYGNIVQRLALRFYLGRRK